MHGAANPDPPGARLGHAGPQLPRAGGRASGSASETDVEAPFHPPPSPSPPLLLILLLLLPQPPLTTLFACPEMSSTTTYLVTGANRGLGLGLVRQILAREPSSRVIAAAREPAEADALLKLAKDNEGRVETLKLDLVSASVGGGGRRGWFCAARMEVDGAGWVQWPGRMTLTGSKPARARLRRSRSQQMGSTLYVLGCGGSPKSSAKLRLYMR